MNGKHINKWLLTVCVSMLLICGRVLAVEHFPGLEMPLKTNQGPISLADLKGKIVYLDFWASWCGPCRKSFPWMSAMQAKYADQGLVILAVNLDSDLSQADDFLQNTPANFRIAYDTDSKMANRIGLKAMPSSFLLNKQRDIIGRHLGFQSGHAGSYENEIRQALGLRQVLAQESH